MQLISWPGFRFIIPGWYVILILSLLSLKMGVNWKVSSNRCMTTVALKPWQQKVTSHIPQANAIIQRVHKFVNDMLRSFDLEKENLEEDNATWLFSSIY